MIDFKWIEIEASACNFSCPAGTRCVRPQSWFDPQLCLPYWVQTAADLIYYTAGLTRFEFIILVIALFSITLGLFILSFCIFCLKNRPLDARAYIDPIPTAVITNPKPTIPQRPPVVKQGRRITLSDIEQMEEVQLEK
uniref:Uncharacterized protein n=1 Tax=Panagrolaimus davidi TaxID=227884 RepID=A0A914Q1J7_9BILA